MKYIIWVLLLLNSLLVNSQSKYVSGYYVTVSGDTVTGYIQNKDWLISPKSFSFRKSLTENESEISVKKAAMFVLVNNEVYVAKKIYYRELPEITFYKKEDMRKFDSLSANVFVRLLIKGELSLHKFVSNTITTHYLITSAEKEELLVYEKYRIYSDSISPSGIYEVENKQYQRQLKKLMGGRQELFPKIDALDYADKQIIKIVSLYNQGSSVKSETLTNRSDKMKFYIRPAIGVPVSSAASIKNLFTGSIGIDFVLPRNFERLVFMPAQATDHSLQLQLAVIYWEWIHSELSRLILLWLAQVLGSIFLIAII